MTAHTPEPWPHKQSDSCTVEISIIDYAQARACVNGCATIKGYPEVAVPAMVEALARLVEVATTAEPLVSGSPRGPYLRELTAARAALAHLEEDRT